MPELSMEQLVADLDEMAEHTKSRRAERLFADSADFIRAVCQSTPDFRELAKPVVEHLRYLHMGLHLSQACAASGPSAEQEVWRSYAAAIALVLKRMSRAFLNDEHDAEFVDTMLAEITRYPDSHYVGPLPVTTTP